MSICLGLRFSSPFLDWLLFVCFLHFLMRLQRENFDSPCPPSAPNMLFHQMKEWKKHLHTVECCFGCSCLPGDKLRAYFFSLCWCVWMFLRRGLINIWSAKGSPAQTWGCLKVSCTWSGSTSTTERETQGEMSLNVCAKWNQGFTVSVWWISTL